MRDSIKLKKLRDILEKKEKWIKPNPKEKIYHDIIDLIKSKKTIKPPIKDWFEVRLKNRLLDKYDTLYKTKNKAENIKYGMRPFFRFALTFSLIFIINIWAWNSFIFLSESFKTINFKDSQFFWKSNQCNLWWIGAWIPKECKDKYWNIDFWLVNDSDSIKWLETNDLSPSFNHWGIEAWLWNISWDIAWSSDISWATLQRHLVNLALILWLLLILYAIYWLFIILKAKWDDKKVKKWKKAIFISIIYITLFFFFVWDINILILINLIISSVIAYIITFGIKRK